MLFKTINLKQMNTDIEEINDLKKNYNIKYIKIKRKNNQ